MQCFYPVSAYQLESGEVVFYERKNVARSFQVRCGRCIGCKLDRSQSWAQRCLHESQLHEESYFVTLTYDENNCPRSLVYRHFQLFMKRLRRAKGAVRFFMCGEYGEKLGRPHYHACIFGLKLDDLVVYKRLDSGFVLYTSKFLEGVWEKGFCVIGAISMESAAYVARYCTKKITGDAALAHYTRVCDITGEIYEVEPEFGHMSLKPGIGARWIEKYKTDVFGTGRDVVRNRVIIDGNEQAANGYYKKFFKDNFEDEYGELLVKQYRDSFNYADDCTSERLAIREAVTKARLNMKRRDLE